MPKHNPKHNANHRARVSQSNQYSQKAPIIKPYSKELSALKFSPQIPSRKILNNCIRKNEDLLLEIESIIIDWAQIAKNEVDVRVINAVGGIIYTSSLWEKNPNIDPDSMPTVNRLDEREKELFTILLNLAQDFIQDGINSPEHTVRNCFACIYESALLWTKQNGSQGYLEYIAKFVPSSSQLDEGDDDFDETEEEEGEYDDEESDFEENDFMDTDGDILHNSFSSADNEYFNLVGKALQHNMSMLTAKMKEKAAISSQTLPISNISKKKVVIQNKKAAKKCGLCGSTTKKLTKTPCCNQWICDDTSDYVMFSYANNSCYRNHDRYTLCSSHYQEEHSGDWKTCKKCREDIETEMYVWYGTNEYNFEKLPNPPSYKPKHCAKCKQVISLGNDGFSVHGSKYYCMKCGGIIPRYLTQ
jgi:hypothetical protein